MDFFFLIYMNEIKIETQFFSYDSIEELNAEVRQLMDQAIVAREKAYAPYSNFRVGAAVLLKNGAVVIGSNQENAAFPSGLCAERTAVFSAGANFPNEEIVCICITASSLLKETTEPIPPCGACRQSLLEYENRQKTMIPIYFMGKTGRVIQSKSVKNLLPFTFNESNL